MAVFEELRWLKPELDGEYDGDEGPYFRCDSTINKKLHLYMDEIWKLPVDCMVIGQNQQLSDRTECSAIFALAGPLFEEEVESLIPVQTSSSVICNGYNLCPHIILSIGPRYDVKYIDAAESALHQAYKKSLMLASENPDIKIIALNCIYLKRSKYPRDEAAHVTLRTVRKFMQHEISQKIGKIVFCVPPEDFELYNLLMTAYFPRTAEEGCNQVSILPEDQGDEWGSLVKIDRSLKVTVGPRPLPDQPRPQILDPLPPEKVKTGMKEFPPAWPAPKSMRTVVGDEDEVRIQKIRDELSLLSDEERIKLRLQYMVSEALEEELHDMFELNFFSIAGEDRDGRVVAIITAANVRMLTGRTENEVLERMVLYIIKRMEELRTQATPYVLIYAYSGMTAENAPDADFVQNLFDVFVHRLIGSKF